MGNYRSYGQVALNEIEIVKCSISTTVYYKTDQYIEYEDCEQEYNYDLHQCEPTLDCTHRTEYKEGGGGSDPCNPDTYDEIKCNEANCTTVCPPDMILNNNCECVYPPCNITCPEGFRVTPDCGCEEIPPPSNCRVACLPGYTEINCTCVQNTQPPPTDPDPCESKLLAENKSNLIANDIQSQTKDSLETASIIDGEEHSITFGRDPSGLITQSPRRDDGGLYNVPVTQNWPGAFAAVHNHLVDYPPSAGDVYTAVTLITNNPNFATSYINMPNGDSYAIVVTNPTLAKNFVTTYPKDQISNNPPEFPQTIFDEILDYKSKTGESVKGKIDAIVIMLDNHNAGISILKKDSNIWI